MGPILTSVSEGGYVSLVPRDELEAFDLAPRRTTPLGGVIFKSDDLTARCEKMFLLKQDVRTLKGLAESTSCRGPFGKAASCTIQDRLVVRL